MNKHFNQQERDLVKLAGFFKKQSIKLMEQGMLGEEHKSVQDAVDRFLDHMNSHVNTRTFILEQHEYLNKLVKDNARCPKCLSSEKLKVVGVEKNEKGWRSNRYKCRKCNVEFTWNLPNNPWHMIEYIQEMLAEIQAKADESSTPEDSRAEALETINNLMANLNSLKPVIDAHDREYRELQSRESEMERLMHEFKNSLTIEKIKMDTWDNRQKLKHNK
jgi:DNA-binding transcriptional regulator GbsR (MarR family)